MHEPVVTSYRRRLRGAAAFLSLAALGTLLLTLVLPVVDVRAAEPATTPFRQTWERPDRPVLAGQVSRTWMWGPEAFSEALSEPYAESPGGARTVQYYDKSRMEITDPNGDPAVEWYVTNGLLVVELMSGQLQIGDDRFEAREPAIVNVAGDADAPGGPTYMTMGRVADAPARAEGAPIVERLDRSERDRYTQLDNLSGLDHTRDGLIHATDNPDEGQIKIYRPDGTLVDVWTEVISDPVAVAVGQEAIYVLEPALVKKFTFEGELLTSWDVGGGNPYDPTYGIALDAGDNVYVTQSETYKVHKYDPDGTLLASGGELGENPGEFTSPIGIAVHDEEVYVTDFKTSRVLVFDLELNYLREWGSATGAAGYWDIDTDIDGYLYIANQQGKGSIEKRTPSGELVVTPTPTTIGVPGGTLNPVAVSVQDQGQIYVAVGARAVVMSIVGASPQ